MMRLDYTLREAAEQSIKAEDVKVLLTADVLVVTVAFRNLSMLSHCCNVDAFF